MCTCFFVLKVLPFVLLSDRFLCKSLVYSFLGFETLLLFNLEFQMPIVHQMHTAQSFKRSFCKEAFCTSHQSVSVRLTFPPCRYHFNVVASSAVIGFLVMSQCTGGMARVQMPFSQLSLYSADAKREERDGGGRERDRALLYLCGGSRWHPNEPWPQPLTHSVIYTHQEPHNLCQSSYCSTSLPHHYFMLIFPMRAHTHSISRCLIFIIAVGRAESQPSTPAT